MVCCRMVIISRFADLNLINIKDTVREIISDSPRKDGNARFTTWYEWLPHFLSDSGFKVTVKIRALLSFYVGSLKITV